MFGYRFYIFLISVSGLLLLSWPGAAAAQQQQSTEQAQATETQPGAQQAEQAEKQTVEQQAKAKEQERTKQDSEAAGEGGDAPFVDKNGDGINDAMEYRFRRCKGKQRKDGKGTRHRYMKGRGAKNGAESDGAGQGSSSGGQNSHGNSGGN